MIDQSYSADNFYRLLDYENRKGNYKEGDFFESIQQINNDLKEVKTEYRNNKKTTRDIEQKKINRSLFREKLKDMNEEKKELLLSELHDVSDNIVKDNWQLELRQHFDSSSQKYIYLTGATPETFFALKQTQYCIKKLYKVKQSHRNNIVNQVKLLLSDGAPKVIIRADIKNFFESIPIAELLRKINKDNLLSQLAKKIISRTINSYHRLSNSTIGVPRGIGISAYLSELYLREFDNEIRRMPNVFYYARYVDDILILCANDDSDEEDKLKTLISEVLMRTSGLKLNMEKTSVSIIRDLKTDLRVPKEIEYLGYKFLIKEKGIEISLSEKKIKNYRLKIDKLFRLYAKSSRSKGDKKLLVNGIRFLTGNTRLINNKSNVLIGVYYSNTLLTNSGIWNELDKYVQNKFTSVQADKLFEYVKNKGYSFKIGFESKKFVAFKPLQMKRILTIWKDKR
ncbi:antiviral reverse transcriptase Drt3a [Sphingobacterium paucimobilis]|uniref:Reverse transcriptase domain-containing protein n=1 Tax=Sphingobacterium paucimobilis HER1398 TaxID=1346330 RepID=U2H626_9SPHI|nr:antiviral reverse transcriptase Drt3a [Sphingobacterium paucimobilis]ERJ57146.1 hypothetical protein M472_00055 [Sphingobacterium paucimobilis HER1398]